MRAHVSKLLALLAPAALLCVLPKPQARAANTENVAPPAPPAADDLAAAGTLRVLLPPDRAVVVRGTIPIPPRSFRRNPCPLVVLAPDGTPLPTQWERVARMRDFLIVEVRALLDDNRWSGWRTLQVVEGTNDFDLDRYVPEAAELVALPGRIRLLIERQGGGTVAPSLSGIRRNTRRERRGPVTTTIRNSYSSPSGGLQAWLTLNASEEQIGLILNLHNGSLPASPDVYTRSHRLILPSGWTWTPVLPDPAARLGFLVKPDHHVFPQRMERSFRVVIHRVGEPARIDERGFGVGDWSAGGYLPQAFALPDLSHATIDLAQDKAGRFARLANNDPTVPGHPPVSFLWPAQGVQYGGMTSGIDIEQIVAVPLAVSGQAEGLLSLYVEQLRYGARHMGCIYGAGGNPIELDRYLEADGSTPWNLFNNRFIVQGGVVQDEPFGFSRTGPGLGFSSYDPTLFEPIDQQHMIRRTKANKALVWLANDPLARLYLHMDAELGRMTYHEGPGGRLRVPSTAGSGTTIGRAEAWLGDLMSCVYAIAGNRWRARNLAWFQTFAQALRTAQMPSGLFSATIDGKIAETPPFGDGSTAFFWAHRSNEQVFLMLALRGIERTTGIPTGDAIRSAGVGLWRLAWKPGQRGPLARYPAGPLLGPRYRTRTDAPSFIYSLEAHDHFHVATALGMAIEEGAFLLPALLAHTGAPDLAGVRDAFERSGLDNIANRANVLTLLQSLAP